MNEQEIPAQIETVRLTLKMDATITVTGDDGRTSDWLKPGAEASVTWRGQPTREELIQAYVYLQNDTLAPMLEDVISSLRDKMVDARRSG
jgi:hypothetical protein